MPQHQRRRRRPESSRATASTELPESTSSNQAQIEAMQSSVTGSLGRLFARITGTAQDSPELADSAFSQAQLEEYIEDQLNFAEGEWFRGAKISGVAEKLMSELDQDQDGLVNWEEFQGSVERLKTTLGITSDTATAEEVAVSSGAVFDQLEAGSSADMDEVQTHVASALPPSTEHLSLVAQFAARMAIDLADTDQRSQPVADRSITRDEWVAAALDLADI